MLSKCFASQCSATFQYLGQGKLFRIDFTEASRKRTLAGQQSTASARRRSAPIEHFWLCERCAATSTIELSEASEVCVVPRAGLTPKPIKAQAAPKSSLETAAAF